MRGRRAARARRRRADALSTVAPPPTVTRTLRLAIVPATGADVPPDTVVAGVPLVERIALAAARAGFTDVRRPGTRSAPAGPSRVVLVPANVVPQTAWLRALAALPPAGDAVRADASGVVVVDTDDAAAVLAAAAGGTRALVRRHADVTELSPDADGRFLIAGPDDLGAAERWLLRSLIKPSEGFMSRHFERRISLALTRRLVRTRLTPNAMTLVSLAVGFVGAPFFLAAAPALQLTGALLFLAHSILDGCDGELARLRFQESRWGALLDFWGDNAVHVAVFASIAIGWSLRTGAVWPLLLGAVAAAASLGTAARLSPEFVGAGTRSPDAGTPRILTALAHRDFIYLVVGLSALGKAAWFLVLTAAGTPAFLLLLLWSGGRRHAG